MAKVTDVMAAERDGPVFATDFTPPRSGGVDALDRLEVLRTRFISVAYNPGKLVRADSVSVAYALRQRLGFDTLFNFSPRDMNKIALESRLLGAQLMGLENVVVLQGDPLGEREHARGVSSVGDYTATELLRCVQALNRGVDYRGRELRAPADFCLGATLDPNRELDREVRLTAAKARSGAEFFISQAVYDPTFRERFLDRYAALAGEPLERPVLWGVQILTPDGVLLGEVPRALREDLERGRSAVDIALEQIARLREQGVRGIYLVPPIRKGGARDYEAAREVLRAVAP